MSTSSIRAHASDITSICSAAGQAEFARGGLNSRKLSRALNRYEAVENVAIGTLIGLSERGVFCATRKAWVQGVHATIDEFLIHLPWERVDILLGRTHNRLP